MKTILKLTAIFSTFLLITFSTANAQRLYSKRNPFFVGIETSLASQSLQFSSDIAALKSINSLQVGPAFGLVAGTNVLSGKLVHGNLTSSDFTASPMNLKQFDASVIFNPMQLMTKGQKYFEVYLTTGAHRGSIELAGKYMPKPEVEALVEEMPPCSCPCCSPTGTGGPMADPDMVTTPQNAFFPGDPGARDPDKTASPESGEQTFSEKLVTDYINVGAGLQVRLQKKQYFANLFAEVKYGVAVNSKSNGEALANTKATNQLGVSFGIRVGLTR